MRQEVKWLGWRWVLGLLGPFVTMITTLTMIIVVILVMINHHDSKVRAGAWVDSVRLRYRETLGSVHGGWIIVRWPRAVLCKVGLVGGSPSFCNLGTLWSRWSPSSKSRSSPSQGGRQDGRAVGDPVADQNWGWRHPWSGGTWGRPGDFFSSNDKLNINTS